MKLSPFQEKLVTEGYCDARGVGFCATARQLPDGSFGMVALCLMGNVLSLYDVDMKSNLKELLFRIKLSDVQNLKISRGFLVGQTMKFQYEGFDYSFTNMVKLNDFLKVIEEESKK